MSGWAFDISSNHLIPTLFLLRRRYFLLAGGLGALGGGRSTAVSFESNVLRNFVQSRYGSSGVQALEAWLEMLKQQVGRPRNEQIKAVNTFWNHTVLASEDRAVWSQSDYWATPLESLGKRAGDCEDYAIGKYFSLLHLGFPTSQMRFIYVRARIGGMGSTHTIAHMVLAHYAQPESDPVVLDNLIDGITPASQRKDLTPVFSFNALGVYLNGSRSAPVERINRWQDLLARMRAQGMHP